MFVIVMISGGIFEVEINLFVVEYICWEQFDNYYCIFDIYLGEIYLLKLISVISKVNVN